MATKSTAATQVKTKPGVSAGPELDTLLGPKLRATVPRKTTTGSGLRVLLAHEPGEFRNKLSDGLREWGHKVLLADNGEEIIDRLGTNPDILVIQQELPDTEGTKIIESASQAGLTEGLKIVLLSESDIDEETRSRLHVDAFFKQPVNMRDLIWRIDELGKDIV